MTRPLSSPSLPASARRARWVPPALSLALALALPACATTSGSGAKDGAGSAIAETASQRLFRAAGDQAVVTVMGDPRRFAELRDLSPFVSMLSGRERRMMQSAMGAASPWVVLGEVLRSKTPWPAEPAGWDGARPVVLALFEAPAEDLGAMALRLMAQKPSDARAQYTRHRVLVPARDPALLVRSLEQLLGTIKGAPQARSPGVFGMANAVVALLPGDGHVRIEIGVSHGGHRQEPPWELLPLLQVAPPPAAPPRTPAQRFASAGGESLVAYLRPDRLRDAHLVLGGGNVARALRYVDPSMKATLLSQGLSEILTGALLLEGGGGEVQDSALGLSGGTEGLSLTGVLSLSAAGQALWGAAAQAAQVPQLLWQQPVVARATLGLSLGGLLKQAAPPQGLAGKGGRQLAQRVRECGGACALYLGLRHPLGSLRAVLDGDDKGIIESLPLGGAVAVLDAQRDDPRGALAVTLPSSPLLDKLLGGLQREIDRESRRSSAGEGGEAKGRLRRDQTPLAAGVTLHRFGMGQDPSAVFAAKPGAPSDVLWDVEVDTARAQLALGSKAAELTPLTATYAGLRQRVQLSGPALVGRTTLVRAYAKGAPAALPTFSGPPAEGAAAPSAGERCLSAAAEKLSDALGGVAGVEPAQRAVLLQRASAEIGATLRGCAGQDREARGRGERLLQAVDQALLLLRQSEQADQKAAPQVEPKAP